jgi:uncharacterized protein involved in exopolysaccharide biosynthesis
MPHEAVATFSEDEVSLLDLWKILWQGKWHIIGVVGIFGVLSIVYALTATEWYRAEVLLAPAKEDASGGFPGNLGGVGNLASLAGLRFSSNESAEAIAVLESRDFTRSFIEDKNLLPVLLADQWDAELDRWKNDNPEDWPDMRDAIKFFSENVRSVSEDVENGLVTLSVEWRDPEIAATWARDLVARVNNHLRLRALSEAERNVDYLREQLSSTNVATLRESIGSLLELELQKLMLARGNEEFAFRVIDSAQIPKERSRPNRILIVVSSVLLGGFLSVVVVFIRHGLGRHHASSTKTKASD